jgi:hypothetical protein
MGVSLDGPGCGRFSIESPSIETPDIETTDIETTDIVADMRRSHNTYKHFAD